MSVLIRGITIEQFYKDLNTVDDMDVGWDIRQLPPHGRLIDADVVQKRMEEYGWKHPDSTIHEFLEDDVPTIIEAEEEE